MDVMETSKRNTIEAIESIEWVRSVEKTDSPLGTHTAQTDISVVDEDDIETIQILGVNVRAISKIGDYRGQKLYVEI